MFIRLRRCLLLLVPLTLTVAATAQQQVAPTQPGAGKIYLDVAVTPKSGPPVSGLQQQDFTLLDNNVPQTLTSFQALGGSHAPIEVILLIDAVNTSYITVAYERGQLDQFLRAGQGRLAFPTALAIFTDSGIQVQEDFSTDGNALSASLDQYVVSLRTLRRSAGYYGAAERFQYSIEALRALAAREVTRPGRKLIIWISPGWPLLPWTDVNLDSKDQQEIFANIVNLSTQLRQARITLYSIDPRGTEDLGSRTFYWETFLKGVENPNQVQLGNLGLQVLAAQSGGLALMVGNDLTALLRKCLADSQAYYEISFDPRPAQKRDEYHHLEIRLAKPGLTARTRQGYYSQPSPGH